MGRSKAFSLVEAVIVLFIFCLIFTIPTLNISEFKSNIQIQSTRKQVKSIVDHYARQAIITNKGYRITCYNSAHEINIVDGKTSKIIKIDPDVEILNLSGVWISPKGSMTPRTIAIMAHGKRETIKVQMKWGRMIDG